MTGKNNEPERHWYVIRVTYSRELLVKAELDRKGVECFIPMQYQYAEREGRRIKILVPSIHNLIFIRMSEEEMVSYKATTSLPIRYMMDFEKHKPLVVPDWQMRNFIAAAGTYDEQLIYLDPQEADLKKGDRVRVTGGLFEGLEGTLMRIKGDRRVVVSIPGVIAVATAFIHQSLIQKIEN